MILAIDAGNTHIVLGMIENGEIRHIARIHTEARETGTEYALKLRQIIDFHGVDPTAFEGAIIGSVVPPVTEALRFAAERVTGCRPMVVGPGVKTGMNIRIDDPTTVAADLIVGAVAANTHYGAPCIVIDMGTATTMIVVDRDGCFRGGAIAPGVKLGYRALSAETSLLPEIAIQAPLLRAPFFFADICYIAKQISPGVFFSVSFLLVFSLNLKLLIHYLPEAI